MENKSTNKLCCKSFHIFGNGDLNPHDAFDEQPLSNVTVDKSCMLMTNATCSIFLLERNTVRVFSMETGKILQQWSINRCSWPLQIPSNRIALVSNEVLAFIDGSSSLNLHNLRFDCPVEMPSTRSSSVTDELPINDVDSLLALNEGQIIVSRRSKGINGKMFSVRSVFTPTLSQLLMSQNLNSESDNAVLYDLRTVFNGERSFTNYSRRYDMSEYELVRKIHTIAVMSTNSKDIVWEVEKVIMSQRHFNSQFLSQALQQVFCRKDELELILLILTKLLSRSYKVVMTATIWLNCTIDAHFFTLVENKGCGIAKNVMREVEQQLNMSKALLDLEDVLLMYTSPSTEVMSQQFHPNLTGYVIERLIF